MDSQVQTLLKKNNKTVVPQQSVLGPFLFLLYVNDMQNVITNSRVVMFADDTTVKNSGSKNCPFGVCKFVYVDICDLQFMSTNVKQCHLDRKCSTFITLLEKLVYKISCKYLGIRQDTCLRLREHIDYVVGNLDKFCSLMYNGRDLYPRKRFLMF